MTRRAAYTGTGKRPPQGAATVIGDLARDGWSKAGIARKLGASTELLTAWMESDPKLQAAFDDGREREHHELFNALYRQAIDAKNTTAAIFLLKARHGYKEGAQDDPGNRINITFALPGALPMEKFVGPNTKALDGPAKKKPKA